jgi:transposase
MSRKSGLTVAERKEVVLALLRGAETASVLARRWGISETTLYNWRDQFMQGGEEGLTNGKGKVDAKQRRIAELEKELEERDRVIGELTIANRILKKTTGGLR